MITRTLLAFTRSPVITQTLYGTRPLCYSFGIIEDKLKARQEKKMDEEFKAEIQSLANKPTFTLLDFKQRTNDELVRVKKNLRAKLSNANQETEQSLEGQRKILNAFFEQQLVEETKLTFDKKKEIALVAQVSVQQVHSLLRKFLAYKKMHMFLRELKENGEPLPRNFQELQREYMMSGVEFSDPKMRRRRKYAKHSRRSIAHSVKFGRR